MTKLASLDQRKGQYVAASSSLTTDGFWIGNGAFDILDAGVGDRELGEVVRRMLAASGNGVPTPDLRNGPSPFAPVLAALGLRSYATYAKGTRHVSIEQDGGSFVVTPSHNGGAREGITSLPEHAIRLASPDDEELGRQIRVALDRCTWGGSSGRTQKTIDALEVAARAVEVGLSKFLRIPSTPANESLRLRLDKIAAALRAQQVNAATPDVEAILVMRRVAAAGITAVCSGRLGSMPMADVPASEVRLRRLRSLGLHLRSIFIALVPLAIVVTLNRFGLIGADALGRATFIFAVAWAAIGLLITIDPLFSTKLNATKDLLAALRGGESKK